MSSSSVNNSETKKTTSEAQGGSAGSGGTSTAGNAEVKVERPPPRNEPHVEPVNGIVQPAVIPPASRPGRITNQLVYLKNVVMKGMFKHQHGWPFLTPVDTIKLELPDYFKLIKYPMDMTTVKKRLENNYYWCSQECIDDVTTMFKNCYVYNKPQEDVVIMAQSLEKFFQSKVKQMPPVEFVLSADQLKRPPNNKKTPNANRGLKRKADNMLPSVLDGSISQMSTPSSTPKISTRRESGQPQVKKSKLPKSLAYCNEILRELFNKRHSAYAWPFYKPVDASALGLHDYHTIIKKPMDLGTVKEKMDNRKYFSADEFADDVRTIFKNCYTYNPDTHDVVAMARKLEEVFEGRFKNVPSTSDDYEPPPEESETPKKALTGAVGALLPPAAVNPPAHPTVPPSARPPAPQRELRPHPQQPIKVDDSDSDSDTITRDKNNWYQRLLQVQEQMRQLEEQIRVLVEESFMRKRRRMEPQASTSTTTSNTQGGRVQPGAGGPPKRVRKPQPQGTPSAGRAKKSQGNHSTSTSCSTTCTSSTCCTCFTSSISRVPI